MSRKVGVRFKSAGKVYDFDCGAFVLDKGDTVIVETKQGLGYGAVVTEPVSYDVKAVQQPYKKVCRLATVQDRVQLEKNKERENAAHAFCQECITQLGLKMNLFSVESTFDAHKITFFFTADGRVDFRQLVKMLVKKLSVRIEMRQVGIRNQAKMCGGLGRCGREQCCTTFMAKFDPVSIRMAKEQGLSLNPTKISGQCGRLMCCLTYEYETYIDLKRKFPKLGKFVHWDGGSGKVIRQNVICGRMLVRSKDGTEKEIALKDIRQGKDTRKKKERHGR
jgi:cell fate regulator YaaT (PSP1 superfamily)